MVYNSIEKSWKPSFNENIVGYNDGIERYIWTDADGTKHWFAPYMEKNYRGQYLYYNVSADGTKTQTTTPTEFYPDDDIDYVLTKTTNNELILKDYQGNQRLFDGSGRLSKICDAQGNVLHFNYWMGRRKTTTTTWWPSAKPAVSTTINMPSSTHPSITTL